MSSQLVSGIPYTPLAFVCVYGSHQSTVMEVKTEKTAEIVDDSSTNINFIPKSSLSESSSEDKENDISVSSGDSD